MIDEDQVIDAILARLRDADPSPVGDLQAPPDAPDLYSVLEHAATQPGDGDLADTRRHLWVACTVRTVRRHPALELARKDAGRVARKRREDLLDASVPLAGDGWVVSDRMWQSKARMAEGSTANVVDQFLLWVVPA